VLLVAIHPLTNPNNCSESVFIARSQSITGKILSQENRQKILGNTIQF